MVAALPAEPQTQPIMSLDQVLEVSVLEYALS